MKKIIRKICLPLLLLGASVVGKGQITWYYGYNAGVKFNSGVPTAVASPNLQTYEGSAVLVDKNNNVVMYCNGTKVWNGNHVLQSPNLNGDASSTQTALIVPVSGELGTKAFIFTVAAAETGYGIGNSKSGLQVSLVNIAGTAPATTITTLANANLTSGVLMSEKLTITEDGSGGYWVLAHGVGVYSNYPPFTAATTINNVGEAKFYAYHIDCAATDIPSLDASEVVSTITNVAPVQSFSHSISGSINYINTLQLNAQGQMKFSKDGTKIVNVLAWLNNTGGVLNPDAQLFNFDKSTGQVDNTSAIQFSLGFINTNNTNKDGAAYGVEFSADSKFLYVSSSMGSSLLGVGTSRIYQYNINVWNSSVITASKYIVASMANSPASGNFGALMRGPNDKIYIAKNTTTAIDAINTPNILGVGCGYSAGAVLLPAGGRSYVGLPTTVLISNNPSVPVITSPIAFCKGSNITLNSSYTGNQPFGCTIEAYGSNAAGAPVDANGNAVANLYSSFYSSGYSLPYYPTSMTFPDLTANAICGKYYSVKITLYSECGSIQKQQIKTFYIECNNPAFNITTNTSNSSYYTVSSTPVDAAAGAVAGFNYCWRVEGYDANYVNLKFKFDLCKASGIWTTYPSANVYKGFNHASIAYTGNPATPAITAGSTPLIGQFKYNYNYKLVRTTSNNTCGWKEAIYYMNVMSAGRIVNGRILNQPLLMISENPNDIISNETTGIAILTNEPFAVYPNPSNGIFTVELKNENNATMNVIDITGKVIKSAQLNKNDRYILDLSDYSKGIYMIKMNGEQQYIQKIILQ